MKKHINKFESFITEDVVNKNSETATRLVIVMYNGKEMTAVAIGYASGPFFKEVYYLLEDIQYDGDTFDSVTPIDPMELVIKG